MQEIQRDLDAGNLENIYVKNQASENGEDMPLSELQAMQLQQRQEDAISFMQPDDPDFSPSGMAEDQSETASSSAPEAEVSSGSAPEALAAGEESGPSPYQNTSLGEEPEVKDPSAGLAEVEAPAGSGAQSVAEQSTLGAKTNAGAAAELSSSIASPNEEVEPPAERQLDAAAQQREAEKLAKQRELFGGSFSKPKR